jgi:hypothetical protein
MNFLAHTPHTAHLGLRSAGSLHFAVRTLAGRLSVRAQAVVWVCALLLLLATLAPGLSRMLVAGDPAFRQSWVEVCSSEGMRWERVDPSADGVASSPMVDLLDQLDACGYCTLGLDRGTPPPPDFSGWGLSQALPHALPAWADESQRSPALLNMWARGPPARS